MFYDHFYNQLHAFDGKPLTEECGVVFYDRTHKRLTLRMIGNSHSNPRHHYRITTGDMRRLLTMCGYMHPVALFHTHVDRSNPDPSEHDYDELANLIGMEPYSRWYGVVYNHRLKVLTRYTPRGITEQLQIIGEPSGSYVAEPIGRGNH